MNTMKVKPRNIQVYFGHPSSFWRARQKQLMNSTVDVNEMKKLGDFADYDLTHIQQAIINNTIRKVSDIFHQEEHNLENRRKKLKILLDKDEEGYIQEIVTKQEMEECGVCAETKRKVDKYEEEIEKEKIMECQKALERELISKGMQCTKSDEINLRAMQKLQMEEKKFIDLQQEENERLWHLLLIEDIKRKEKEERIEFERRQKEMLQRRMTYDEQISSANRLKNELIRKDQEIELRNIERVNKKLEQDNYNAINRKREQQKVNRKYYLEDINNKYNRLHNEKYREFLIDRNTVKTALDELNEEKQKQLMTMQRLQIEKKVFLENYKRERKLTAELDREFDKINEEWIKEAQNRTEEHVKSQQLERERLKEKMLEDYKQHLTKRKEDSERSKREREMTMEKVRRDAVVELEKKLSGAQNEFQRQMCYRNSLNYQIEKNEKVLYDEINDIEYKQKPFTDKAHMFKEAMAKKIDKSPGRISTNPMHPFLRVMTSKNSEGKSRLPAIDIRKINAK